MPYSGSGSGTSGDPYLVATDDQLNEVRDFFGPAVYWKQTANIALTDYQAGAGWVPIGTDAAGFSGFYDGQKYTISALRINSTTSLGVFGKIIGTVQNLKIDDADVTGSGDYVGALTGQISAGTVKNIIITDIAIVGRDYVGPVVGSAYGGATVENCIVGTRTVSAGTASGRSQIGGAIGFSAAGTFTKILANAACTGTGSNTGGLVGYASQNASSGSYSYCAAYGNSSGVDNVGGFCGRNSSKGITNSYARGSATASGDYAGGFTGYSSGEQVYSYSTGVDDSAGANENGFADANGLNSYWDTQTSGDSTSAAGTGKTTAEMKTKSTYSGWDFTTIWWIKSGIYPELRWIEEAPASGNGLFFGGGL
jgi:hypothetical protein